MLAKKANYFTERLNLLLKQTTINCTCMESFKFVLFGQFGCFFNSPGMWQCTLVCIIFFFRTSNDTTYNWPFEWSSKLLNYNWNSNLSKHLDARTSLIALYVWIFANVLCIKLCIIILFIMFYIITLVNKIQLSWSI